MSIFKKHLSYIEANKNILRQDFIELIEQGIDLTKPNVAYWIMCLARLIEYHKEEIENLGRIRIRLVNFKNTNRLHLDQARKMKEIEDASIIRVQDRINAILSCTLRILRDAK